MPIYGPEVTRDRSAFRSHQPMFNLPPVTRALLVANFVVFAVMMLLPGDAADAAVALFGFTPARYGGAAAAPVGPRSSIP